MNSSNPLASATMDLGAVDFVFDPLDHPELENCVVSPCGRRLESFDYKGNHFEIDWDELVGDEDEEEIPHEQVMEEMRVYCEELAACPETAR